MKKTGEQIVDLHNCGKRFFVGRGGGIGGKDFTTDIESGEWRTFDYEVDFESTSQPNRNWFSSSSFVSKVSKSPEAITPGNVNPDAWHFSHLGADYFKKIGLEVFKMYSVDVPIRVVYVGKTGEPYEKKNQGRNVNPNWWVKLLDGKEIGYNTTRKKIFEGRWELGNCSEIEWEEIRKYFEDDEVDT